jgi:hypothetical protein
MDIDPENQFINVLNELATACFSIEESIGASRGIVGKTLRWTSLPLVEEDKIKALSGKELRLEAIVLAYDINTGKLLLQRRNALLAAKLCDLKDCTIGDAPPSYWSKRI